MLGHFTNNKLINLKINQPLADIKQLETETDCCTVSCPLCLDQKVAHNSVYQQAVSPTGLPLIQRAESAEKPSTGVQKLGQRMLTNSPVA